MSNARNMAKHFIKQFIKHLMLLTVLFFHMIFKIIWQVSACAFVFWVSWFLTFSHLFSPQCVTVIWHDLASSRRKESTSARQTISGSTVHAATAVTASLQERWSPLWDAHTTPCALSAVSAGTQNTHTHTQSPTVYMFTVEGYIWLGNNTAILLFWSV